MNYYKQGEAAKAEQIKAAFNGKGIYSNCNFANENYLYYQCDGKVAFCFIGGGLANIIKTHPDYKELELPVEPKFKVGGWVVYNGASVWQVNEIDRNMPIPRYELTNNDGDKLSVPFTSEYNLKEWTIQDAKDGDVLVTTEIRTCPFIYDKSRYHNSLAYYYAGIDGDGDFVIKERATTLFHFGSVNSVIPATKEQRELLFKKMKEAGYQWDADKKELRKIQPHYDISNLHVGMPVLVRADNVCRWNYSVFSHITGNKDWQFAVCNGVSFTQCIPFEGNEHLLGTTDMCDKMYINW